MTNTKKIRGRIAEMELSHKQVAEMIGMSAKTFSVKLKSGKFGLDEAEKMIKVLKIDNPNDYFFTDGVA